MVTELYKNSPEYADKDAKYIWHFELFPETENQLGTDCIISNGYAMHEEESLDLTLPIEDFFYDFVHDGNSVLKFKKAVLTIKYNNTGSEKYNTLDNPDNVRLTYDNVCELGLKDKIVRNEDGTPNVEASPWVYTIKCMFNELPADQIDYNIDFIDINGKAVKAGSGTVKLIAAPWDSE